MDIEVLDQFYSIDSTSEWDYSSWSDAMGWPTVVEIFGGRLFWGRGDTMFGSVSDQYRSFDDQVIGDSAPIIRSLNSRGYDGVRWLLALQRLIAGTDVSEVSVRSSAFDEPLTALNWHPLDASTQGGADIRAVKSDKDGIFVTAAGRSVYRAAWNQNEGDYSSADLTALHQDIFGSASIVAIAIQRKPDSIIWFALSDGGCRALTYEPSENVIAWSSLKTDGNILDVSVARGSTEDSVYFKIDRNGSAGIEKLSQLRDCRGGNLNCLADAFTKFSGAPTTVFSVPHLDGRDVTVWADGAAVHDQGNLYTVSGGQVTLAAAASDVVIGLPYIGDYVSTKLAYGAALGTAMFQKKRVSALGLYFVDTILDGVRVGRDAANLFAFTTTKDDGPITPGELQSEFDGPMMDFAGDWDTDSRIHVKMQSPYPCTVAALAMQVKTNDKG